MRILRRINTSVIFLFFLSVISSGQDLKSKVDSINTIPYQFIISNTRQSIKIFSENLNLAREIKYLEGEAKALSNLGLAHYLRGEYDKSAENYHSAIGIYENKKDLKVEDYEKFIRLLPLEPGMPDKIIQKTKEFLNTPSIVSRVKTLHQETIR
jgi:tetratricopeptide (TPR) repeat protein